MFLRFDEQKGKSTTTHMESTTLHYYPRKNIMLLIAFIHVSTTFFFRSSSFTSVVVEAYPFGSINSMVSHKHQVHGSTSTSTCPHFSVRHNIYSKNTICHHSRRSVSKSHHWATARTDNDYLPSTTTSHNNNENSSYDYDNPSSSSTEETKDHQTNPPYSSSSLPQTENKKYFPPGTLGPPEPIRSLKIGESIAAYRYSFSPICVSDDHSETTTVPEEIITNFNIERVSYTPDAFVLRNFLTEEECNQIITDANDEQLSPAETITKGDFQSRKKCQVSWIPSAGAGGPNKNKIPYVSSLVKTVAKVLLSRTILSHSGAGVEDLQVLKYDVGGEFVLHHDGESRILTAIYYVNGVAGTWFPLARTDNDIRNDPLGNLDEDQMQNDFQSVRNNPKSREHAMALGEGFEPGKNGLLVQGYASDDNRIVTEEEEENRLNYNPHVVRVNRGDALAFYNFCDDGSARLNWRALHTGLPTKEEDGVKWIANHWFRCEPPRTYP